MLKTDQLFDLGRAVMETEAAAISQLTSRIDDKFSQACEMILNCTGRLIVIGMGKSGHIGKKIAATLASTGTPAFFVHPGEASHGDMGMITANDLVLALSNSGNTAEINNLLPLIKRLDVPLISLTGNPQSMLAHAADINLDVSVPSEACPLGLAPTASTTASLVMGDALAIALLQRRGFTADDFARRHPGGSLGKRLLLHVSDIMHTGMDIPTIPHDSTLTDALLEMTNKRLGMTLVLAADKTLLGIFTDGDLRRSIHLKHCNKNTPITQLIKPSSHTISPDSLAIEALNLMQNNKITSLIVLGNNKKPIGVIHMHDLLQAGVI